MATKQHKRFSKILNQAANLLETKGWCKGEFAKNDETNDEVSPLSKYADRFCAIGAICAANKSHSEPWELRSILDSNTPGGCIIEYNDSTAKDKRYVIRLFRRVARKLMSGEINNED